MSNWGISPNASEKEKIKADYADILHGMNSTGAIPYDVYSDLFDDGMELLDRMYEQGKADHLINNNVTVQEEGYWGSATWSSPNGNSRRSKHCGRGSEDESSKMLRVVRQGISWRKEGRTLLQRVQRLLCPYQHQGEAAFVC